MIISTAQSSEYPRIGLLWGCGLAETDYDTLARYQLIVAGGPPDDPGWEKLPVELRKRNPDIKFLNTSLIAYMTANAVPDWMKDEWFLKRPDGSKVAWWADCLIIPNLMNDECFNALIDNCIKPYVPLYKKGVLDGFFFDSMVGRVDWFGEVDINGDGVADDPAKVDPEWHARQNLFFDRVRELMPNAIIIANDVDYGHMPHVNGRFFEGGRLYDRLFAPVFNYTMHTPQEIVYMLNERMKDSIQPGFTYATMTHPLGWQFWRLGKTGHGSGNTTPGEIDRARRDYQRMRVGLTTALMTDTYYGYDFGTIWWGHRFWYAEFEAPLGKPLGLAREVYLNTPKQIFEWHAGERTDGLILEDQCYKTDKGIEVKTNSQEIVWRKILGTSSTSVHLKPGKCYRVIADCKINRRTEDTNLMFLACTEKGGSGHDKSIHQNELKLNMDENIWHIDTLITPDKYDDYRLEWRSAGPVTMLIKSLKVMKVEGSYMMRDFEGGSAFVNTSRKPVNIKLKNPMRRLRDDAAPRYIIEIDDDSKDFAAEGKWEKKDGEAHYYGTSYRLSGEESGTAKWSFNAPSSDTYTVFVNTPGGDTLSDKAEYSASVPGATAVIDQRKGDGGWIKLFDVKLSKGQKCKISLRNAGTGVLSADAVRVESAARYNDGAQVNTITLAPLDGIILLKEKTR